MGGVDYTNNAVVEVTLRNNAKRLIWQYASQNNPSLSQHGRVLQRTSDDAGQTWSWPPLDLTAVGSRVGYPGATPGPGVGIQLSTGRVVFCTWGNKAQQPFTNRAWSRAANFANFLAFSDDMGATWQATAPIESKRDRLRNSAASL